MQLVKLKGRVLYTSTNEESPGTDEITRETFVPRKK